MVKPARGGQRRTSPLVETLLYPLASQPQWGKYGDVDLYFRVMAYMRSDGRLQARRRSGAYIFHVFRKGSGIMSANGVEHLVDKDKLFISWPDTDVEYHDFPETPWSYLWFWLAGVKASWVVSQIGFTSARPSCDISACSRFKSSLRAVERNFRQGGFSLFYPIHAAWELMDALKDDLADVLEPALPTDLAERCRIYIENHIEEADSVEKMARLHGVDRSTLYRLFMRSFGISPKEYIDRARFEKACRLLTDSHLTVKQVAAACGFESSSYFTRAFQRRFQQTPAHWSENLRQ